MYNIILIRYTHAIVGKHHKLDYAHLIPTKNLLELNLSGPALLYITHCNFPSCSRTKFVARFYFILLNYTPADYFQKLDLHAPRIYKACFGT